MYKNKNLMRFILSISLVALFILFTLINYNSNLRDSIENSSYITLEEVMQQQKFNIVSKLENEKHIIKKYANLISQVEYDENSISELLDLISTNSEFEYILYANHDGRVYNYEDQYFNLSQRDFFVRALNGETVISEPQSLKSGNDDFIIIASSIIKNGLTDGVLMGAYRVEVLDNLFLPSFGGYGYSYATNDEGDVIAKYTNDYSFLKGNNLFQSMKSINFYEFNTLHGMEQDVFEDKSGSMKYNMNGDARLMKYDSLGINGWNIFVVVPESAVSETANDILTMAIYLTLSFILVFGFLLFYVYNYQKGRFNELYNLAYTDSLTNGINYRKFKIEAKNILIKNKDIDYVLIKMDIDKFKLVNNLYGFEMGNNILKTVSETIDSLLNTQTDIKARINSDEFIVLVAYTDREEFFKERILFESIINDKIKELINYKIVMPEGRYFVDKGDTNIFTMLEKVNFAHKLSKKEGRWTCIYDDKIKEIAVRDKEIENKMEEALKNHEFVVFLQPKYDLKNEDVVGAEALVRWLSEGKDFVYPDSFIPIFEGNGFITKLDMYMFEKVCKIIREWIDLGISPVVVSVNFSRLHLRNGDFVVELSEIADKYQVPHDLLEIELTETAIFDNIDILKDVLNDIHKYGFTLSMDDFGTGYSSLGLLKNIPVDVIKIDRGFFADSKDEDRAFAVIGSVMSMAKKLNITTVAEGVESEEHINFLKKLNCDIVQGYYYARPMPAEDFKKKMQSL